MNVLASTAIILLGLLGGVIVVRLGPDSSRPMIWLFALVVVAVAAIGVAGALAG